MNGPNCHTAIECESKFLYQSLDGDLKKKFDAQLQDGSAQTSCGILKSFEDRNDSLRKLKARKKWVLFKERLETKLKGRAFSYWMTKLWRGNWPEENSEADLNPCNLELKEKFRIKLRE